MKRRDFLALAGATAAFPRVAFGQASRKVPRVALVTGGVPLTEIQIGKDVNWSALLDQMEKHGYVEGKTVTYDRFFAPNDAAVQLDNARKILASAPDAIFWGGAQGTVLAALPLNRTIPMVIETGDPLAQGMVSNLAHPGGNATAIAITGGTDFEGKTLAVLAEAAPDAKTFAYTNTGENNQIRPTAQVLLDAVTQAATRLGLKMVPIIYSGTLGDSEFVQVVQRCVAAKVDMVLFGGEVGLTATSVQALVAKLTTDAHLPSLVSDSGYVRAGGLMTYSASYPALARQCADYIALVLGGANPGDLPVLGATAFDIGINLKTAKAMGFAFPPSILAQATLVIGENGSAQ